MDVKTTKFFDIFNENEPDWALDVFGGNPYSPVWICGLEFGNVNFLDEIEKARSSGKNQSICRAPLIAVDRYEYSLFTTAIVGCLTDQNLWEKFETMMSTRDTKIDEIIRFVESWAMSNRLFCWGGHGFQMNSGVLALPSHNNWQSRVYQSYTCPWESVSIKEFTGKNFVWEYRSAMLEVFKKHVQNRLLAYRPKLVICTGSDAEEDFKKLFLDSNDNQETVFSPEFHKDFKSGRKLTICFKGYWHKKTNTHIVVTRFISDGRAYSIHFKDLPKVIRTLKGLKELSWLEELKPIRPLNELSKTNHNLKLAAYLDKLINGNAWLLVETEPIKKFLNKYKKEAQQEFGYILHQLRPNDWNLFINSADDLALFNSICTRLVKFPNQTEINELILAINEALSKIALINKPEVGNYGDMPKEYYSHM